MPATHKVPSSGPVPSSCLPTSSGQVQGGTGLHRPSAPLLGALGHAWIWLRLIEMANSLKNLVKTGFGLGIGVYLAQIVFLLIGAAFFFPGYVMFQAKTKERASASEKILPFVLMAIGVVIMGGIGFGFLVDNAGDLFE